MDTVPDPNPPLLTCGTFLLSLLVRPGSAPAWEEHANISYTSPVADVHSPSNGVLNLLSCPLSLVAMP